MTNPLDHLNLRPQERRVLVVVTFLIFVVLNFLFVRPLFGQFGELKGQLEKTRGTLGRYSDEIAKGPGYERQEKQLKETGSDVLSEELQLQRIVDNQARVANVMVSRYTPGVRTTSGRTNQFFEDQGLTIDFVTGNKELVDFLIGLAAGNSMIRVQDMTLRPDASGTKLTGNILFVASYQKKAAAPAAVRPTTGAVAKPGTTSAQPKSSTPTKAPAATNTVKPKAGTPPAATKAATNTTRAATNSTKLPKK